MKYFLTFLLGMFLTFCSHKPSVLDQVRKQAELRVITRDNPTSYYIGPKGPTGLEYELAARFAQELGVSLRLVVVPGEGATLPALLRKEGHLVAAGLVVTPDRKREVRFGPTYQHITQQLVYRRGNRRPREIQHLLGRHLVVASGSFQADLLRDVGQTHDGLTWHEHPGADSKELLSLVWEQRADCTIADSNELALTRRYYPELRIGFDIGPELPLAWAFPRDTDDSLYLAAIHFFNRMRRSGELEQLLERHYGHVSRFDYVGTRKLLLHVKQRLPKYEGYFRAAGDRHGIDWRLLAAVGYQESHWNPLAVSPTHVKGIMMLTLKTAGQLGVKDRRDPEQSILGGARYFAMTKARIAPDTPEPDRSWFALAAYNVGFGHLDDARRLTRKLGGDPNKWVEVKKHLPLLSQEKWYTKTRYGYARGQEPVNYVENVRRYYDLLVWVDEQRQPVPVTPPNDLSLNAPRLQELGQDGLRKPFTP